jgi:hypothetical protein
LLFLDYLLFLFRGLFGCWLLFIGVIRIPELVEDACFFLLACQWVD